MRRPTANLRIYGSLTTTPDGETQLKTPHYLDLDEIEAEAASLSTVWVYLPLNNDHGETEPFSSLDLLLTKDDLAALVDRLGMVLAEWT